MAETSSFLRWAGSKKKLIPTLKEYWSPKFNRYIEPFAGSAQLFFSIDNSSEYLISDKNQELIETFTQIQNSPYEVYRILKSMVNNAEEYYKIRGLDSAKLGKNQRAARFIYLNWLCFNGLYRTNKKGEFNVPYSGEIKKNMNNWNILKNASKKLKNVKIVHGDFEEVIKRNVKKNDFVYLDPPYAIENVRIFNQYGPQTFGWNDLKRLKLLLQYIDKKGGYFLLSYASDQRIIDMFSSWKYKEVNIQRNIAGFAEHRRISKELLFTNIE